MRWELRIHGRSSLGATRTPQLWFYFFFLLQFHFLIQTLIQQKLVSILIWTPIFFGLLLWTFFQATRLMRFAPQVFVWLGVLFFFVLFSGYYPERDNDGISFWMPKAMALKLYGFLPNVTPQDPRFTISHDYPIGMISLSAFLHSFVDFFDIRHHRWSMMVQSLLLWWAFFSRTYELKLSRFWSNALMLLLVGIQPAIWTHGYHDAPWAFAATLGLSYLLIEKSAWAAFPFLAFAQTGKSEAQIIMLAVIPVLAFLNRRFSWIFLLFPTVLWLAVVKGLGFHSSREVAETSHSVFQLAHELWSHTWPLLKFQTLYGATSVALYLAIRHLFRINLIWLWIPALSMGIYCANYLFSTFDLAWNVKFSWARILLFPCFFIIFMSFFQDTEVIAEEEV